MHNMQMPQEFLNEKSLHSMMFLLFSRVYNEKDLARSDLAELCKYESEIMLPFNHIFLQNTVGKR